ncbi:B-box zinc finger protein 20 [Abeliophyllum distichum]|uniref:B-box zinc finger protein 20 n=1 Tax=Abeliophyllum distichum TaxID=126358 RepID=A0ABD1RD50_9LAMI
MSWPQSILNHGPALYHILAPPLTAVASSSVATNDKSCGSIQMMNGGNNGSTSSISEYLIDTLPGWHVEDFLDSSSSPDFFKVSINGGNNFFSSVVKQFGIFFPSVASKNGKRKRKSL